MLVDTKGNCIPKTSLKDLDSSLVASSFTEVVGITTKKDVAINVNTDRQTVMDAKIYGNTISGTKVGNDGTIDLVVTGKNLIDYTTPWKINIEGTTFSLNDGVLTINFNGEFCSGIYKWNDVGSNFKYIFGDKKISGSFDSKSSVNKKYKVSFFDYLNNYFDITTEWNRYSATNKTALNSHRELAFYDSDVLTVSTLYAKNIQIELGSSATSYEPYKEQRYVLELKDTSGHIINGIGTGETIEKQNGRWGVNNGSTFTELIGSTQTKLNNIKLYDGVSNVFLDETIQPSNLEIKYYQ